MTDLRTAPAATSVLRLPQLYQLGRGRRLLRTSGLLAAVGVVVVLARGAGFDRPEPLLLVLTPALVWAVRTVGRRPLRLDPVTGTLTVPHRWCLRRRVRLSAARSVSLVDNGRRYLVLAVDDGGRGTRVPLLRVSRRVQRSQSPEALSVLADQLARQVPRSSEVVAQLRVQATFLAGGGDLARSPLARLVRRPDRWDGAGRAAFDLIDLIP